MSMAAHREKEDPNQTPNEVLTLAIATTPWFRDPGSAG